MVRLDYLTMRSQHILWVLIPIYVFFCAMGPYDWGIWITVGWFSAFLPSALFGVEEKDRLDKLYGSLTISARNVVLGRYLFVCLLYVLSLVITLIIYLVLSLAVFHQALMPLGELGVRLSVSLILFLVFAGIQLPLNFRWGYSKAMVLMIVSLFAIIILFYALVSLGEPGGPLEFLFDRPDVLVLGGIALGCVALFFSYHGAVAAYRRKRG
jgi:ABC-type transport system involved in multi-copper enzyme maturation permease subunit